MQINVCAIFFNQIMCFVLIKIGKKEKQYYFIVSIYLCPYVYVNYASLVMKANGNKKDIYFF